MRAGRALLMAAGAGSLVAAVSRAVATRASRPIDEAVREWVLSTQGDALDAVSQVVTGLSAPAVLVAATLLIAAALRRRGVAAWLPVAASPFAAMALGRIFTETLPQQTAPCSDEACFPSGHTTGLTAEAIAATYVLRREGLIGKGAARSLVLLTAVAGINRLYRDRHWASDIVAGWGAGAAVGCACIAAHEVLRRPPTRP